MTTMPSQVAGHPAPWMDLPASTANSIEFSDCTNGSLVIDITPVAESDGETHSDLLFKTSASDTVTGHEPKSRLTHAEKDVARLSADDCILLDHGEKATGEKAMSDVIEIDPVVEGGMAEETVSKCVKEVTIDDQQRPMTEKDVYFLSVSDTGDVTVICPDSADEDDAENSPKTKENSENNVRPISSSDAAKQRCIDPCKSLGAEQEKPSVSVAIAREGHSSSSEVSQLASENAVQRLIGQDSQSEQRLESRGQPKAQGPSKVSGHVATEKMSNSASHPENRGAHRTEKNLAENQDRTLISYLTDFPSRMRTLDADPTPQTNCVTDCVVSGASAPRQRSSTSNVDSVRINSTATASSVTIAHKVTNARVNTPQPSSLTPQAASPSGRTSDLQMVSETKQRKRKNSPTSVIPIHVKEENVDDSYEATPQPTTKVQIVDVSVGQRQLVTRRQEPVMAQGSVVRMPVGNLGNYSNSLQSVLASSAAIALPTGRLRTMPTYRFSHFRTTPAPKNIPTSSSSLGSSSIARFVSLYSQNAQNAPRQRSYQAPNTTTVPAPQYLLSNARRTTPTAIQPKTMATSAPCFILVNRQNPGSPQIAVAATTHTTYAISASVSSSSSRAKCETAPLSNGKSVRPLKVRPSNTNAALLTRKFERLYKKSILPKFVSPKLMPSSLHVSTPLKMLACEGCGDEFITERGLSDHYERKSVVISFTCRCDRKLTLFYNMCSFARFYERHTSNNSFKQHSSYDSCVMAMLPPYLMPPEYHRLVTADGSRKKPEEVSATPAADGPTQLSTKAPLPVSDVMIIAHEHPSPPVPSITEFFELLERRNVNCTECGAVYKRHKSLAAHMSTRRSSPKGSELFRCDKCCMVLPNACSFRAHARIHNKIEPYVCPECGLTFRTSRDVFMKHVKKVCLHFSRFESRQCPVCSAALSLSAETMIAHIESAHAASYHKCNSCTVAFPTEKSFHSHSLAQHNDSATSTAFRKCPICSATENEEQSLAEHLGEHVKEDGFAPRCFFRCLFCRTSFAARSDLVDHMKNTHPSETISGQMCGVCGTVCDNGFSLYSHTRAEHEDFVGRLLRGETENKTSSGDGKTESAASTEAKPLEMGDVKSLECDRCQMVLSDDEQFKRHVAKHRFLEAKRAGTKLSEAKVKKKRRKEGSDNADKNVQIKSEPITDEVTADTNSNQSTPVRSSRMSSTSPRTIEPEKPPSDSDKDISLLWFSCHLCEKTFKNTNDLNQHLKDTHTGKSRLHAYLCWICREQSELKSYPKAGMLIKHLKNYHKIARKNIDYARIASFTNKDDEIAMCDDEKPAKCEASLVRNLRVEGDATYNCAKCEFSSAERGVFLEHVAKHRQNESHQCLECGVCFVVLPSLKRHLFVVHRVRDFVRYQSETGISVDLPAVDEPDSDPDSFASPNVGSRLSSIDAESSFLSETPSTTSPEKESASALECTVCYRSFADQWTLRQHMRVHGMAFIQGTRRNNMSRKSALSDSLNTVGASDVG